MPRFGKCAGGTQTARRRQDPLLHQRQRVATAANANNSPMVGTTGFTGATPIWHDFMRQAFQMLTLPARQFQRPPGLADGRVCRMVNRARTVYGTLSEPDLTAGGTVPYCSVPVRRG